jgi:hypothetical protein
LAFVGAIVWAVSIFNVICFGFPIVMWMASIIAVAIFALIGGGISLLFKQKALVEISTNGGDEKFYEEVARELQDKPMIPGLWTKAFAEMGGDDAKARALYIKDRVAQFAEANRQQREQKRAKIRAAEEQQRAEIEAAERQSRTRLHRFCHTILWLIFILLTIVFGLCGLCVIIVPFTEDFNSSDLFGVIGGAIFSFLMAFVCGLGTALLQGNAIITSHWTVPTQRFDAAATNRRMFWIFSNVHFPMPAAFAFLAVSFGN